MATEGGVPKKKSLFLRDVIKLCRSIARLWPHHSRHHKLSSSSPSFNFDPKAKPRPESKRDAIDLLLPEAKADVKEGGVRLCRVRSYRYDGADLVRDKKPSLSRSCSQSRATPLRRNLSSSSFARSKSSCNSRNLSSSFSFGPSVAASTVQRTFTNPILYSTSAATVAKPPPTKEELVCTLEELCKGCTKKIMIKRDVLSSSGEMSQEEEMVEIKVKPGWKGGTKVTFEGKGNEAMGSVAADLTFVIAEKEHKLFTREGDDLEMEVAIPLVEALTGCEISVALPDGDTMNLRIDDVIHHGYTTLIEGKGMPRLNGKGKRGDLRIRFRTKFPERFTEDQRADIRNILEGSA
ncbi:PREDICTED: dnaJ homolog subfamily B member 13-like [Tarenaya hassleriana]|uniref:dnaJ homolog subfamily B member 13-like n=1 Tax=Tarenaya hassleriana TaxID=28532 RepID=UPI00053C2606|nr:PREDICTED: dnaJ homolog subfamily B member 13-like [Tarenaya hassleriana]